MFLLTPRAHGFTAQIVLRNGTVAGEGKADTRANAQYFACLDAIHNGYPQAAMGHATMLSIRDENAVRAEVASSAARPNPRLSPQDKLVAGATIASGVLLLYWLFKPAAAVVTAATPIVAPGNALGL